MHFGTSGRESRFADRPPGTEDQRRQRRDHGGGRLVHQWHDGVRTSCARLRVGVDVFRTRGRPPVRPCAGARHPGSEPVGRCGAVRGSSRRPPGQQACLGARNPDQIVQANSARDRLTWPSHGDPCPAEPCIALRRVTCFHVRWSGHYRVRSGGHRQACDLLWGPSFRGSDRTGRTSLYRNGEC